MRSYADILKERVEKANPYHDSKGLFARADSPATHATVSFGAAFGGKHKAAGLAKILSDELGGIYEARSNAELGGAKSDFHLVKAGGARLTTSEAKKQLAEHRLAQINKSNPLILQEVMWGDLRKSGVDGEDKTFRRSEDSQKGAVAVTAVFGYSASSTGLNMFVAGDPKFNPNASGSAPATLLRRAKALDSAIAKAPKLEEDIQVFRGMDQRSLLKGVDFKQYTDSLGVSIKTHVLGKTITDPAYGSTSASLNSAAPFLSSNRVLANITVKKGTSAVVMGNRYAKYTKFPGESEILLKRDQKYRVTDVRTTKRDGWGSSVVVVDMETID